MAAKRVLIIEDDTTLSTMYKERLELEGYDAFQAFKGDEGLEIALDRKPDLILLDLMLPAKGGMNVLQVLKTEPVTKSIPVVVITALVDEKYRHQALHDGAIAHFVKSETTPAQIVEKIKEVLK